MLRARLRTDETGLSVVELLASCALSLVIVLGAFAVVDAGNRTEGDTRDRQNAFRELRDTVDRATRDIRQATALSASSSPTVLDLQTFVAGTPTRLIYAVEATELHRTVCTSFDFGVSCGGAATTLAEGVSAGRAFCYDSECEAPGPSATLKMVRIQIARTTGARSEPITVATDVQLRNL